MVTGLPILLKIKTLSVKNSKMLTKRQRRKINKKMKKYKKMQSQRKKR
jgi:hypothetical protein